MKTTIVVSLFALSVIVTGGCASMHEKSTVAVAQPSDVDDAAYVARVERIDRARGITVRWVNPPQKRVTGL
jgi:hypothetical protein